MAPKILDGQFETGVFWPVILGPERLTKEIFKVIDFQSTFLLWIFNFKFWMFLCDTSYVILGLSKVLEEFSIKSCRLIKFIKVCLDNILYFSLIWQGCPIFDPFFDVYDISHVQA